MASCFPDCQMSFWWGLPAEEGTCPELDLAQQAERVLFIGWRRDIADLIQVLDDFVAPGSELWLYNEVRGAEAQQWLQMLPDLHTRTAQCGWLCITCNAFTLQCATL